MNALFELAGRLINRGIAVDDRGQGGNSDADLMALLKPRMSFAVMGEDRLERIIAESQVVTSAAGVTLFQQGDPGSFAFLVLEGDVAIEVDTPVGKTAIAVVTEGGTVGEVGAFASTPRTASVTTLTPCRLLRIEQAVIREIMADHPEVPMAVISELGRRLQSINGNVATLIQAARALAEGTFEPAMLEALKSSADQFSHFARVFQDMAGEIDRKRIRRQEMETAAEIQSSFLPHGIDAGPLAHQFDIAAFMRAARDVGGDFYDYFMIDHRRLGVAIGDVSGKGVPAAMFMSVSRTVLKTIAREGWRAGECLTRMNQLLAEGNTESMFVTLFYGAIELDTGEFEFCSAGHNECYLLSPNGERETFTSMGPAIGLFEGVGFRTERRTLKAGQRLFLYTDGVTEAFDRGGRMFGAPRLEKLLDAVQPESANDLVGHVAGAVDTFAAGAPQADDITCLALIYKGAREIRRSEDRRYVSDRRDFSDRRKGARRREDRWID